MLGDSDTSLSGTTLPQEQEDMTKYVFILSPPYSGSTVLWQLLQTSPHVSALPTEGQYMEPVKQIMTGPARDARHAIPWARIKGAWSKHWDFTKPLLLDKGGYLSRAKEIEQAFGPSWFIVMMRDPYALCEGLARRRNRRNRMMRSYYKETTAQMDDGQLDAMEVAAARWRRSAVWQAKNCRELERVICVTYEELAENTSHAVAKIMDFLPELGQLDVTKKFLVHSVTGTDQRVITNMNETKWQCLYRKDIDAINSVLSQCQDTLDCFGYRLREADRFQDLRAAMIRSRCFVLKLKNEGRQTILGRRIATTGRSRWLRMFRPAAG
jgi:hypothetical protein